MSIGPADGDEGPLVLGTIERSLLREAGSQIEEIQIEEISRFLGLRCRSWVDLWLRGCALISVEAAVPHLKAECFTAGMDFCSDACDCLDVRVSEGVLPSRVDRVRLSGDGGEPQLQPVCKTLLAEGLHDLPQLIAFQ